MNTSAISLTSVYSTLQDGIRNKGSLVIMCNTHKPTFKVVAKSSHDEKASIRSNSTKGLLTSLTSSVTPLISNISNTMAYVCANVLNPPLPLSVDPKQVLTGNFASVGETAPTECFVVEGELPPSLNGAYIRNGPNPLYMPVGPYHLWSGDGMLHSIRISDGRAIFCSRFVKTSKYELERAKGFPIIPNFISGFYGLNDIFSSLIGLGRVISERINIVEAVGVANTNLAFFNRNLFALADGGLPYSVRLTQEGDIETLREYKFTRGSPINMNAHPKVDAETKEVFTFQLHIKHPYLTFFRCDGNGSNWEKVPIISMNHICLLHDFVITKKNVIFFDTQLEVSLTNLLKCKGMPVIYKPTKVSRIGVLPRYATSDLELKWFEAPGLNAFHILNSWEEGNQITIITPTVSSPDNFLHDIGGKHVSLEKVIIDTKTGDISRTTLSDRCLELGSINPAYQGKKNRYVYMAIHDGSLKLPGVVKIDLELKCEVANRYYGPGCFGGEALFVPRCEGIDQKCDEDDGFIVSYMHDETNDESYFMALDAKSLEFVCKVKLPSRVPYGLHGIFVNDEQLQSL